jgi:hypothetical protein
MLFRKKDFHGGRAYEANPGDMGRRALASQVIDWIKLRLGQLTRDDQALVRPAPPLRNGEGFSLLGSDERHARQMDTMLFPMPHRRRDARQAPWRGGDS